MPSLRERPRQGLQLGWIPNDPGRRPRDYAEPAPADPVPDPDKEAAVKAAREHGNGWIRLLVLIGVLGLILFGFIGSVTGRTWFWGIAVVVALGCWLPAASLGWWWRKTVLRLRQDTEERQLRHAGELAEYEERKSVWQASEVERAARAPRWLRVTAADDLTRLDVFGGTSAGRRNMLTGLGLSLLEGHAVIVLDLSNERVCAGLVAAAAASGLATADYQLPRDLRVTPLLSGLTGEELASQVVEVTHADDPNATNAGRAADRLVLSKIGRVLGADVSMARLHEALGFLLDDGDAAVPRHLRAAERDSLAASFGEGFRREVAGSLIRLTAVVEPLRDLGADAGERPPGRLTCLSVADGPRDVTADLTAALIVQWATRSISASSGTGPSSGPGSDGEFRPAVILAGADEQDRRHLARLTAACDRYGIPLVRTFSRLTEESARHLDSRNTAFMRLATRPEALRAAEHIGMERRFVAAQFSLSQRVSRSRTKTQTESVTHSTGSSEGGSHTRTSGTTEGESSTVTETPYRNPQFNVNVENHTHVGRDGRDGRDGQDGRDGREGRDGRDAFGVSESGRKEQDRRDRARDKRADVREAAAQSRSRSRDQGGSSRRPAAPQRDNSKTSTSSGGRKDGKPDGIDLITSKTRFSQRHRSESKTNTWEKTEQTSHTKSTSQSVTKGTSVGDEITYDLSYEHRVQPETLMDLPEDQMLAPHIAEGASAGTGALSGEAGAGAIGAGAVGGGAVDTGAGGAAGAVGNGAAGIGMSADMGTSAGIGAQAGRMVALVVNPEVIGSELTAPVSPDEIPAYQAPPPQVAAHVPAALENLRRP